MPNSNPELCRVLIFGLENALSSPLAEALSHCDCTTYTPGDGSEFGRADLVFCSHRAEILSQALKQYRKTPVVVVSRLPEVDGWLDALEAGAADYCAAPFEPTHMRWLLETHARTPKALVAA